jgi:hypothetical protein
MPRRLPCFLLLIITSTSSAWAEEWVSRNGRCYEFEGRWNVTQESSGVWTGFIDFINIGGPCSRRARNVSTNEVRAAIVGSDFFARRSSGTFVCYLHGIVRESEVRGSEMCSGGSKPSSVAIKFAPQQAR